MAYSSIILGDNPKGYWRLGEASGTSAADQASGGSAGTYTNSPTLGATSLVPGESDTAATFAAGSSQYVALGSRNYSVSTAVSIEMWVNFSTLASGSFYTLFSHGGYITNGFLIQREGGANKLRFAWGGTDTQDGPVFTTTGSNTHIVVTANVNDIVFYVNNVQTVTSNFIGFSVTAAALTGAIARREDNATQYISGTIDDVAIYDYALTATQVDEHYNNVSTSAPRTAAGARTVVTSRDLAGARTVVTSRTVV